ncbi:NUZM, NADH-ubiquinone oxidoreductase 21.3 kDa subunit [Fistulina hepatica ATCC 64428]|uniref:NUZM, NADH-ubiquinone oxidoreductase 21.3 kDa subunit n=1 Tax=Fistulina hepatica ATCC 64428 TaxID=1128425 RepID=A0A0D7A749_9AGAR|nr:NUZM, NADH-ubiquinone oxidoreductase 21.3 kDa subunit [Fistulina hepatica ATCC 64428]
MAAKKAAESTLYHLSPQGFWKTFREYAVVNPEISSGLPLPGLNRRPQPGARPEKYNTPATKSSDIADNWYYKRDVRRAWPQLSVVTQNQLSTLLIEHSTPQAIPEPTDGKDGEVVASPQKASIMDLTRAISSITSKAQVYTQERLPPVLPVAHKRWVPERCPDAPHDPDAYWPMQLFK